MPTVRSLVLCGLTAGLGLLTAEQARATEAHHGTSATNHHAANANNHSGASTNNHNSTNTNSHNGANTNSHNGNQHSAKTPHLNVPTASYFTGSIHSNGPNHPLHDGGIPGYFVRPLHFDGPRHHDSATTHKEKGAGTTHLTSVSSNQNGTQTNNQSAAKSTQVTTTHHPGTHHNAATTHHHKGAGSQGQNNLIEGTVERVNHERGELEIRVPQNSNNSQQGHHAKQQGSSHQMKFRVHQGTKFEWMDGTHGQAAHFRDVRHGDQVRIHPDSDAAHLASEVDIRTHHQTGTSATTAQRSVRR